MLLSISLANRADSHHESGVRIDIEDVIAGVVGSLIGRSLLFCFALWFGCAIGSAGLSAGMMIRHYIWELNIFDWIWPSPLMMFNMWWVLNIPFVLFSFMYFIRSENAGCRAWGIVAGVESLDVMAGWAHVLVKERVPLVCSWLVWAVLLATLECGVWVIYRTYCKFLMSEIEGVRTQNALRRAAAEAEERKHLIEEREG